MPITQTADVRRRLDDLFTRPITPEPAPPEPVPTPSPLGGVQIVTPQGIYGQATGGGSTGFDQPSTTAFLPGFLAPLAREEAKRRMLPFAQQGVPSIGDPLLEGLGRPEGPGIQ